MIDPSLIRPEIALDDFLPIFVSSALVLVFGGLYVGIYTAVKVSMLKKMDYAFCIYVLAINCLLLVHNGKLNARR